MIDFAMCEPFHAKKPCLYMRHYSNFHTNTFCGLSWRSFNFSNENYIISGTHCEYRVFKGQEGILWGDILVPVTVKSLLECSDICDKKSYNGGCFAFQYSDDKNGLCFLFEKPTDIIRHPNSDMDFYEQRRCKPNPGIS